MWAEWKEALILPGQSYWNRVSMDKGVGVDQADRHFRFWIEDVLMKVGKFTIRICFLWFIHIHGFWYITTASRCPMLPHWSICKPGSSLHIGTGHIHLRTSGVQQLGSRWMSTNFATFRKWCITCLFFSSKYSIEDVFEFLNLYRILTDIFALLIVVHWGCVSVRFSFFCGELIRSHGAFFTCYGTGLALTPPPRNHYIPEGIQHNFLWSSIPWRI